MCGDGDNASVICSAKDGCFYCKGTYSSSELTKISFSDPNAIKNAAEDIIKQISQILKSEIKWIDRRTKDDLLSKRNLRKVINSMGIRDDR